MPIDEMQALGNLVTNLGLSIVIVIVLIVALWKGIPKMLSVFLRAYNENNQKLTDAIEGLSKSVVKRIDKLDQRMGCLEDKVDELDVKIDNIGSKGE